MHAAKVILLVVLYVAALRLMSWAVGWILCRLTRLRRLGACAVANAVSYGGYLLFLVWDRIPGDTVDPAAVIAGGVVYILCFAVDLRWTPWKVGKNAAEKP